MTVRHNQDIIRIEDLHKNFQKGPRTLNVLRGIDLSIHPGERISVVGQSGSGKSTFLHLLGTLDRPTTGRIWFGARDVFDRSSAELDALRNREIGFVFQFHHLLPDQDALRNVMMPALIAGESNKTATQRATSILERVGLTERLSHRPAELSGGEQQRVAIARALVMTPRLILADEPTGNLDPEMADQVMNLLLDLNQESNSTLIVVTHSQNLANQFGRKLSLTNGQFEEAQA